MLGIFRKYLADTDGNFAVTTAMMAVPLMVGVAGAIDLANLQRAKSALRDAAETAAIASAKAAQVTDETRRSRAFAAMDENFNRETFKAKDVAMDIELTPSRSTVAAETVMTTQIMKLFGKSHLNVSVEVAAETVIEPACVLVNSPNRNSAIRFQGHPTLNTATVTCTGIPVRRNRRSPRAIPSWPKPRSA